MSELLWQDRYPASCAPSAEEIAACVASPRWQDFCAALEQTHGVCPKIEFSKCTMAPGWNVKYKKRGKALCTLYPDANTFHCMVFVPDAMQNEVEHILQRGSSALYEQYAATQSSMGGRWLFVEVTDDALARDLLALIALKLDAAV